MNTPRTTKQITDDLSRLGFNETELRVAFAYIQARIRVFEAERATEELVAAVSAQEDKPARLRKEWEADRNARGQAALRMVLDPVPPPRKRKTR